jgi:putative MATE family efflux protein
VLVDTAIVGHIGTTQLAALALATTILVSGFTVFNFLTYGTTAQVARLHGAGEDGQAAEVGAQAQWLALAVGAAIGVLAIGLAAPLVTLLGGSGRVRHDAIVYLRIAALGSPAFMLASAGQGFLRGTGDLRTPLVILVCAHAANVVLELVFVYGLHSGLPGSAWGTVIAQLGMAVAFARVQRWAAPDWLRIRRLIRVGSEIAVRTTALLAVFLVCSGVLARVGAASLGAHQIGYQLFLFIALALDAIAIAGQVMVGRMLGAADADGAHAAARRMIGWSVALGVVFAIALLVLEPTLPGAFTDDARVVDRAHAMWPLLVAMMPFNGAVFALDGILIGAGDTRFIARAMVLAGAVGVAGAIAAAAAGWGIAGVWAALCAFIGIRLVTCLARFTGRRWAVVGV